MNKCEFNRCSNHKPDESNNCLLYANIGQCSYQKSKDCPVVKEYLKTKENDYEAYDNMHDADGIVGVSNSTSRL